MQDAITEEVQKCLTFFEFAFGDNEGIVCIGYRPRGVDDFKETFFQYPRDVSIIAEFCVRMSDTGDVYFCTQLLGRQRRTKADVISCPNLWVDLDYCEPQHLEHEPTITIESSPGRFQGLWVMDEALEPAVAEDLSKRITYRYAEYGSDKGGWGLTKYLRVPGTYNYKYDNGSGFVPPVNVVSTGPIYSLGDFADYPQVQDLIESSFPFPKEILDATDVLHKRRDQIHPMAWLLYSTVPKAEWSKELWRLEMLLVEEGLEREEIFAICREAACNKYRRDGRPEIELWREVCKAWSSKFSDQDEDAPKEHLEVEILSNELLTDDERTWVKGNPTIVEDYIRWASGLSDAAWQYHEAGAFIILSALLCGCVRLPTSAANLNTNLWFMILANTTLTRKTTAMGIAMSVLEDLDPDVLLATDGSPEGLLTALSARPGKPSLFLRDEVSGLLEAMKKEYMAGLGESFAKLYDGNRERRQLRKETIDVRDPRLILFTGGVKNRVYELLDNSHVLSGFLPRFLFITAEPVMKNLRPMGPPTVEAIGRRVELVQRLKEIQDYFVNQTTNVIVNGTVTGQQKKIWNASLTDEAWHRFNTYADALIDEAMKSMYRDLLVPTYDRLSKSGLKIATLLAATRMEDEIIVTVEDIIRAFYYIERWRLHSAEVIENLGKNPFEKMVDKIEQAVYREPGITKSKVMKMCQLTARTAEEILTTMTMRGIIRRESVGKAGKYERLYLASKENNAD